MKTVWSYLLLITFLLFCMSCAKQEKNPNLLSDSELRTLQERADSYIALGQKVSNLKDEVEMAKELKYFEPDDKYKNIPQEKLTEELKKAIEFLDKAGNEFSTTREIIDKKLKDGKIGKRDETIEEMQKTNETGKSFINALQAAKDANTMIGSYKRKNGIR